MKNVKNGGKVRCNHAAKCVDMSCKHKIPHQAKMEMHQDGEDMCNEQAVFCDIIKEMVICKKG